MKKVRLSEAKWPDITQPVMVKLGPRFQVSLKSSSPLQTFPDVVRGRSLVSLPHPCLLFSVWSRPGWVAVEKPQDGGFLVRGQGCSPDENPGPMEKWKNLSVYWLQRVVFTGNNSMKWYCIKQTHALTSETLTALGKNWVGGLYDVIISTCPHLFLKMTESIIIVKERIVTRPNRMVLCPMTEQWVGPDSFLWFLLLFPHAQCFQTPNQQCSERLM